MMYGMTRLRTVIFAVVAATGIIACDGGVSFSEATTSAVEVIDDLPPTILNCPSDLEVPAGADCQAGVRHENNEDGPLGLWTAPTAEDNDQVVSFTSDQNPNELFPLGLTTVTYTAVDASEHVTLCQFDISVVDLLPPCSLIAPKTSRWRSRLQSRPWSPGTNPRLPTTTVG